MISALPKIVIDAAVALPRPGNGVAVQMLPQYKL
jgi:hypothetical protein